MNSLPITLYPRQPEAYQLTTQGAAFFSTPGIDPPPGLPGPGFYGGMYTDPLTGWRYTNLASKVLTLGKVYNYFNLSVTKAVNSPSYQTNLNTSSTILVPFDYATINGVDYPIYAAALDRIEFVAKLYHDKSLAVSSIIGGQVADIFTLPLQIEIWGFEIYANVGSIPELYDQSVLFTVTLT